MTEQYYFRINGLNDESCVTKIEKRLLAMKGVEAVEVDLDTSMAVVKCELSVKEISAVIDGAGYNAILIPD